MWEKPYFAHYKTSLSDLKFFCNLFVDVCDLVDNKKAILKNLLHSATSSHFIIARTLKDNTARMQSEKLPNDVLTSFRSYLPEKTLLQQVCTFIAAAKL